MTGTKFESLVDPAQMSVDFRVVQTFKNSLGPVVEDVLVVTE